MLQKQTDSNCDRDSTTWKQLASTVLHEMSYSANRDCFEVLEAQGNYQSHTMKTLDSEEQIRCGRTPHKQLTLLRVRL